MDNNIKKQKRIKRVRRLRCQVMQLGLKKNVYRLCVNRTPQHTYAQIIASDGSKTLAAASTCEKELREALKGKTSNIKAAELVGETIAKRAKKFKIEDVVFDRSGHKYHGRVSALADAARKNGLKF